MFYVWPNKKRGWSTIGWKWNGWKSLHKRILRIFTVLCNNKGGLATGNKLLFDLDIVLLSWLPLNRVWPILRFQLRIPSSWPESLVEIPAPRFGWNMMIMMLNMTQMMMITTTNGNENYDEGSCEFTADDLDEMAVCSSYIGGALHLLWVNRAPMQSNSNKNIRLQYLCSSCSSSTTSELKNRTSHVQQWEPISAKEFSLFGASTRVCGGFESSLISTGLTAST